MTKTVGIVGAGIVGATTALALAETGMDVALFDPEEVGSQTSFGNTGVLVDNPWLVINTPRLWRRLPRIVMGDDPAAHVDAGFVLSRSGLFARFLAGTFVDQAAHAAGAIYALLQVSQPQHKRWIAQAGRDEILRDTGWLKLFRTARTQEVFAPEARLIAESGCKHEILTPGEVAELEPALREPVAGALLLTGACSLSDPQALVQAYVGLAEALGARRVRARVTLLQREARDWRVCTADEEDRRVDEVVVAAGPWTDTVLRPLGLRAPLFWERGYHLHLSPPASGPTLRRAVHDVANGYVMTPQSRGIRITSGVEIAHRDAAPNRRMIDRARRVATELAGLGTPIEPEPWLGSRPSLPDGLPAIGPARSHPGLWLNFGHHHIGMSLSAGSALVLRALMRGERPAVDAVAFDPGRLGL